MVPLKSTLPLLLAAGLCACAAAPPAGPQVAVMPGAAKSFDQFRLDDTTCRQYALQQTGFAAPDQAARQSTVTGAVVGTGLGAAAGAAIGAASAAPGVGAAIGAGTGLVLGSAIGAGNGSASAAEIQHGYDIAFSQCMAAKGNQAPSAAALSVPPATVVTTYPSPYYYPYYGYPWYGPTFIHVGWGWYGGWHHGWRHWR